MVDTDSAPDSTLDFADNRALIDVCGALDTNLKQIESSLDITIIRRGNALRLRGARGAQDTARRVLNQLYTRVKTAHPVESGDIIGLIRMALPQKSMALPQKSLSGASASAGSAEGAGKTDRSASPPEYQIKTRKKTIVPRSVGQKSFLTALDNNDLVFALGPAGTGKTYLAVAMGVALFLGGKVDKIILSRPALEAGERLGFLPGDMKEKIDPYMQPLYDALDDFLPAEQIKKMLEEKKIEIAPLAFMRGRTLSHAFIVLDEAQNTTPMQMKMFLTRLGDGSVMVVTGDKTQTDLPKGVPSGLTGLEDALRGIKRIGFVQFSRADVMRHPLVVQILRAFEDKNTDKNTDKKEDKA